MNKKRLCWAALCLVLLLSACAGSKENYIPGGAVSTHWFDFVVEEVERGNTYAGYQTGEDRDLIICNLKLENTFGETIPMGWMDFTLEWSGGENSVYPLTTLSQEQLPEVYHLEVDEQKRGQLVFEIPKNTSGIYLVFQERYAEGDGEADYTEGVSYRVALD